MNKKSLNLPIEFFVENDISRYSGSKNITIKEMIDKFLANHLFVLLDNESKIEGYIDYYDLPQLREFFENGIKEETTLIASPISNHLNKIPFRKNGIYNQNTPASEVIQYIEKEKVFFVPIINNQNRFIGKISKEIIIDKLDKLGKAGFSI